MNISLSFAREMPTVPLTVYPWSIALLLKDIGSYTKVLNVPIVAGLNIHFIHSFFAQFFAQFLPLPDWLFNSNRYCIGNKPITECTCIIDCYKILLWLWTMVQEMLCLVYFRARSCHLWVYWCWCCTDYHFYRHYHILQVTTQLQHPSVCLD